ncbi:MAG: glycosyltransferase family 4 protein [Synergistaceae bacterium]|nr:glycosyltransferase family 4 protein [Synergistaceae bacterium]
MSKRLVFVSNYFNHHQKALAEEFVKIYGSDYVFVAMTPFNQKRLAIGYRDMNQAPFVLRAYESPEAGQEARNLINEAECVIVGGMPVSVVSSRMAQGKLTFMQSERFFKGPIWKDLARFVKYRRYSGGRAQARDPKAKFYLLCASAFAAWDYNVCGLFRGKAYRWGYFPELKRYDDVDGLISRKEKGSILWAGRFLEWKHPDFAVRLAENLRAQGKAFRLKIIGSGEMQEELAGMIAAKNLNDCVELTGALPVEQVRTEMERAQIFLFTSDRGEGWGVVANEAMNSGCVLVAADRIGAVPYLVKDRHNGIVFRDRSIADLTEKVSAVLDEPERIRELGRAAYETVSGEWSAETAARRFVELSERLRVSEGIVRLWEDGPGSAAPVI